MQWAVQTCSVASEGERLGDELPICSGPITEEVEAAIHGLKSGKVSTDTAAEYLKAVSCSVTGWQLIMKTMQLCWQEQNDCPGWRTHSWHS